MEDIEERDCIEVGEVSEEYEVLKEFMEDIGFEEVFAVLELGDGEEKTVANNKGDNFYANGPGKLYICFIPEG